MIKVIKIGGNVVDNPLMLKEFVKDFAAVPGMKILVHGGGPHPHPATSLRVLL